MNSSMIEQVHTSTHQVDETGLDLGNDTVWKATQFFRSTQLACQLLGSVRPLAEEPQCSPHGRLIPAVVAGGGSLDNMTWLVAHVEFGRPQDALIAMR